ncbi:MAG: amidohydrolase family protein, partial [Thaumarchaeota archaeon]|nr:amidohydrolase family protein [Nitrososphaerota archaeon]
ERLISSVSQEEPRFLEKLRVDVHNHIYPKVHIDAVRNYGAAGGWSIRKNPKTGSDMLFGERGYPFTLTRSASDPEFRLKELDAAGITMQILSPSEPWFDFLPTVEGCKELARQFNNETAKICEKYPDRFAGLAGLPLNDIGSAVEETRRAVMDLGLKGVIVPSRVQGEKSISGPEFDSLFEEFDRLSLPVFIHPTLPSGAERYREFFLGMIILYPQQTSITIAELLFRGSLERFKRLRIMVADLGGGLPLMAGRMFRFYDAIEESRKNVKKIPLEYLKQIYFENGSEFYPYAMKCCHETVGAQRILLGTNHPSPIVAFAEAVKSIEDLEVSEEDKEWMRYKNAKELFHLTTI